MKPRVIVVRNMLTDLAVDGAGKRIGKVPGVVCVTVNFAARNALNLHVYFDTQKLPEPEIPRYYAIAY